MSRRRIRGVKVAAAAAAALLMTTGLAAAAAVSGTFGRERVGQQDAHGVLLPSNQRITRWAAECSLTTFGCCPAR